MNRKIVWLGISLALAQAGNAYAAPFGMFDPRSMAMGGAGTASGTSANASFFNPALLAAANTDEDFSLELPIVGVRVADPNDLITSLDDFQNARYTQNFSDAITAFNNETDPQIKATTRKDAVVSTATALRNGLVTLSDKALQGEVVAGMVMGVPGKKFGGAFHMHASAMGGGLLNVTSQDLAAIDSIITALNNNNPNITDPTGTMTSTVKGRGAVVMEAGFSMAREFNMGTPLAIGITPKYQKVETFDYNIDVDTATFTFDQGRKSYSNPNLDLGVAKDFNNGWKAGLVVKNLMAKTYDTALGNKLELKPQPRAGVAHHTNWSTVALDVDLKKNDPIAPGFDVATQYAALGAEFDLIHTLQLRLGYRHNISDSSTSVASAGLGLSPFGVHIDLGAMASSKEAAAGLQLGFRF